MDGPPLRPGCRRRNKRLQDGCRICCEAVEGKIPGRVVRVGQLRGKRIGSLCGVAGRKVGDHVSLTGNGALEPEHEWIGKEGRA